MQKTLLILFLALAFVGIVSCSTIEPATILPVITISRTLDHYYVSTDLEFRNTSFEKVPAQSLIETDFNPFSETDPIGLWKEVRSYLTYTREETDNWQTAQESFERKAGDCDDFAVFLVTCLITEGYDAYIAVGSTTGEFRVNHAFVVLVFENKVYFLDTTMFPFNSFESYRVADFREYRIKYLFNHEDAYLNLNWE